MLYSFYYKVQTIYRIKSALIFKIVQFVNKKQINDLTLLKYKFFYIYFIFETQIFSF